MSSHAYSTFAPALSGHWTHLQEASEEPRTGSSVVNLSPLILSLSHSVRDQDFPDCQSDLWECVCRINSPPTAQPRAIPDLGY
ncbi:hypothetical protein JOQ06_009835 [Pogonophryne albipinna]|uniref:Uncharacterized protein n=1 Tax=Pogonophryne albipinna TaxID=1090488 RepID=A0AAD6FTZ5_9TELE|nr:hypothetical protein JOQ06_009835 [Pogonophryne albipinna]